MGTIYRERTTARRTRVPVPVEADAIALAQRDRVLVALHEHGDAARDAAEMFEWFRPGGGANRLDPHNVVKTLWSLQKTGHVLFRESKKEVSGGGVSALVRIRLTASGRTRARSLLTGEAVPLEASAPVAAAAPVPIAIGAVLELPGRPLAFRADHLDGLPHLSLLLAELPRRRKALAAADLLESAELSELAIAVLDAVSLTPLERELVTLFERIGLADLVAPEAIGPD